MVDGGSVTRDEPRQQGPKPQVVVSRGQSAAAQLAGRRGSARRLPSAAANDSRRSQVVVFFLGAAFFGVGLAAGELFFGAIDLTLSRALLTRFRVALCIWSMMSLSMV